MEKLIELLNEYIPEGWSIEHGGKSVFFEGLNYNDRIIGKDFGFIKWLVDNHKIDLVKVGKKSNMGFGDRYSREDTVLMLLSIQDNPIEFLISILK